VEQSNKLFEFSSLYERIGVEELTEIDVGDCFDQASALMPVLSVEIINNCRGLVVLADSLLRQVFYNLIDNSLKHGSKVTRIQLGYRQADSALYLI
jgi:signal transduction histidine kinase